jgi:protein TonB
MLANSRSTVLNAVNDGVTLGTPNVSSTQIASNTSTNTLPVSNNTTNNQTTNTPVNQTADTTAALNKPAETVPTFQSVKETKTNPDLTAKNEPVKETPKQEDVKKTEEPVKTVSDASTVAANTQTQPRRDRLVNKQEESKETKKEEPVKEQTADPASPLNVGSLIEFAVQKTTPVYPQTARSMRQTGVVRVEVVIDEEGKVSAVQNLSGPSLLQTAARDAVRKWKFKPFTRDGQPVKATGFLNFNFNL